MQSKKKMYLIEVMEIGNGFFIERHERANEVEYWLGKDTNAIKVFIVGYFADVDKGFKMSEKMIESAKEIMFNRIVD